MVIITITDKLIPMKTITIICAIMVVFQCSNKKELSQDYSLNEKWVLAELADFNSLIKGPKGAPILEVHLDDSTYSGHSGCNSYNGKFRFSENKVRFLPALMTKMYCEDNGLETAYLESVYKLH